MNFSFVLLIAGASGFIALSYEILWYRALSFVSWGLASAFGLLLAAYLLGIALGSRASAYFCRDRDATFERKELRTLAWFTALANLLSYFVVPLLAWSAHLTTWLPSLALVALAAGLLGAVLPLMSHFGIAPDDRAGANLSYVYLANIIGSAAGSFLTGYVFMDVWPLRTLSLALAFAGALLVLVLIVASDVATGARIASIAAVLGACVLAVVGTPRLFDQLYERLLYKKGFDPKTDRFALVVENKSGVIAVTTDHTVLGGGAYDGRLNTSLAYDSNAIVRAYALGALHPQAKRVLMIGLASGSWAQVIAHLDGVESLTIVEINPGYPEIIAKYPDVAGVLTNPKVHIEIDDGRRWLRRHPDERFDLLVMNTTWHWRAHITNLLSTEFMEMARAHLNPGGLFYFNTTSSTDVQKTAATTFPYALRFVNFMAVSDRPIVFDGALWERELREMKIDGVPILDMNDPRQHAIYDRLVNVPATLNAPPDDDGLEARESILGRTKDATIVTDDNMVIEWREPLRFPPKL